MNSFSETKEKIAEKIANWINGLSNQAVKATQNGAQVGIVPAAGTITLTQCNVYQPRMPDRKSKLTAALANQNELTFSGKVSGDDYGVYVNFNVGGSESNASNGTFVNLTKEQALSDIAQSVANSITGLSIAGVNATPAGAKVTITGVQEIECIISSDVRVGQPNNNFASKCSACCDDRIGRLVRARLDVDVALIELDAGQKYKAEIEEIGLVKGAHPVADNEIPCVVLKRGASTGLTSGTIQYLHVDGNLPVKLTEESGNINDVFHRHYREVMKILPGGPEPFGFQGDSGSAVVDANDAVVGILFAGGDRFMYATPIQQIETAFDISIETASSRNVVKTVPALSNAHAAAAAGPMPAPAAPAVHALEALRTAEKEIVSTPTGHRYVQLVQEHFLEVQTLLNKNARLATAWQRNGGPQIIQNVLRITQQHDERLPTEIQGKPLSECVAEIQNALTRYSTPKLTTDLEKYAGPLTDLAGLTYPQVVEAFRNMQLE
jgi:hypothetical protein